MQHCAFAQSSSNKLRDIFPKKHCYAVLYSLGCMRVFVVPVFEQRLVELDL